jgi:NAD(P)-dependent dehydrogenase (short-subunit alcohol dehydrogenase family)
MLRRHGRYPQCVSPCLTVPRPGGKPLGVYEARGLSIAQPEDMVGPTLFLAGGESGYVTGQFLLCNGGLAMVGA